MMNQRVDNYVSVLLHLLEISDSVLNLLSIRSLEIRQIIKIV